MIFESLVIIWIIVMELRSLSLDNRIKKLEKDVRIQSKVINDHVIGHSRRTEEKGEIND